MVPTRVAYVGREIPHYRVPLFGELAERFDFSAFAVNISKPAIEDLKGLVTSIGGWFPLGLEHYCGWLDDGRALRESRPDVLLHEFSLSIASNHVLRTKTARLGTRLVWWGHAVPRRRLVGIGEAIRLGGLRHLASTGHAFVTYSRAGKVLLEKLVPNGLPVFEAPNTVDSPRLHAALSEIARNGGRDGMRERLEARQDPQLVVLARLVPEKRVGATIEAALTAVGPGGLVHVIGDGPDRNIVAAWAAGPEGARIRWWGALTDPASVMPVLVAANALISAGSLGLSAVDAMFAGLPVIASRTDAAGPWHGPEVEYLEEAGGVWWCPSSACRERATLAGALLTDRAQLEKAGQRNRTYAERTLTLQGQARGIARAIEAAVSA